jgi:hypothetical protein
LVSEKQCIIVLVIEVKDRNNVISRIMGVVKLNMILGQTRDALWQGHHFAVPNRSQRIARLRPRGAFFGAISPELKERFGCRIPSRLLGSPGGTGVDATVAAWDDGQSGLDEILAQLMRTAMPRGDLGHDLVVFAMHDQHRDRDFFEVFGEIGLGKATTPSECALATPIMPWRHQFWMTASGGFRARPVIAVERPGRHVAIELRTIGGELRLQAIKHFLGKAERMAAVFSTNGGTALISAVLATPLSPCRPR